MEEENDLDSPPAGAGQATRYGKDELNLAEFPLSVISDRVDKEQKTLVFQDRTWDPSRVETITRQLTITASDEFGLPTSIDDEVILGLVSLTKLRNFESRVVHFTRYELLKLLGWSDDSKNYKRLDVSLKRWLGVTLYYKNAWWDKKLESWVDENFHILDNVTLYDRESRSRRRNPQEATTLSTFAWNDVVFRSFQSGNLRSIDFDLYKSLQSAITKRLYRFLGKRFYHRKHWEFNLKEFAWEHIGLARSYDSANLKRKLIPAIQELENIRFLVPMNPDLRFKKLRSGVWNVAFSRYAKPQSAGKKAETVLHSSLASALIARGVTASTAQNTVAQFDTGKITSQLEVFDWIMANDAKRPMNPPGFLIQSIRGEYSPPSRFVSKADVERREAEAAERKRKAEARELALKQQEEAKIQAKASTVQEFWKGISDEERRRIEAEAIEAASDQQRAVIERGGPLAKTIRQAVIADYTLKVMQMAA